MDKPSNELLARFALRESARHEDAAKQAFMDGYPRLLRKETAVAVLFAHAARGSGPFNAKHRRNRKRRAA